MGDLTQDYHVILHEEYCPLVKGAEVEYRAFGKR